MEALVLTGKNEFEVKEMPVPKPLPYEVLIRVRAVAICGSDRRSSGATVSVPGLLITPSWSAMNGPAKSSPAGKRYQASLPATGLPARPIRLRRLREMYERRLQPLRELRKERDRHRHYGHLSPGVYAQYAVITNRGDQQNAGQRFLRGRGPRGYGGHRLSRARTHRGHARRLPCSHRAGPHRLLVGRLGKIFGTGRVIFVGRGGRLDIASRLCADAVVDFEKEEPVAAVRAFAGGKGVDEAVDCSGSKGTLAQAIGMVRRGGQGRPRGDTPAGPPGRRSVSYAGPRPDHGLWLPGQSEREQARPLPHLLGKASGQDMITHRFPLREFKTGLDYFVTGKKAP